MVVENSVRLGELEMARAPAQRAGGVAARLDAGADRADLIIASSSRHDLDMGGMPELIDRRHRRQPIAAIDQNAGIAREGRRIARHRDDDGNGALGKLARLRLGALARRIEHHGVERA